MQGVVICAEQRGEECSAAVTSRDRGETEGGKQMVGKNKLRSGSDTFLQVLLFLFWISTFVTTPKALYAPAMAF